MNTLLPTRDRQTLSPARAKAPLLQLLLVLAALLLALMMARKARLAGDFAEYLLMTVAVASHGSSELRPGDVAYGRTLMPEITAQLDTLQANMRDPALAVPLPGFYRGLDGQTYAIHFPGYSALAALPFKLFQLTGMPVLKCYQAVNLAMVLVLGLALLRLFDSVPRALAGVVLYMLCGGVLYWNWSSPECLSAAALLAGFAFYCSAAPLRGGLLVGLAALQNPSIVLTLGALPVLAWCLQPGMTLWEGVKAAVRPRSLGGLLLGAVLAALPVLFNLQKFGKPSIIAKVSTGMDLISAGRLHSLYFDLNQGMIVAIPAVAAMLLAWTWRKAVGGQYGYSGHRGDGDQRGGRGRRVLTLLLCVLLTVAYAIPAMTVHNWNSGAEGVMRYAFWSAMPLVFLLLWWLRSEVRWPASVLATVMALQAGAMTVASSYSPVEFSPAARFMLQRAPSRYTPEPEIFAERSSGRDDFNADKMQVYTFTHEHVINKSLHHYLNPNPGTGLCQPGQTLATDGKVQRSGEWIYMDGPLRCAAYVDISPDRFSTVPARPGVPSVSPGDGWSVLESGTGRPTGMWSVGDTSHLTVRYAQPGVYRQLVMRGLYFEGNTNTRITVNGVDLGWVDLQAGVPLAIPHADSTGSLDITLQHKAPTAPGPQDGRKLAFFLLKVGLQ